MKLKSFLLVSGVSVLAACTADLDALRDASPQGDTFTQRLASDYLQFASFEADRMFDWRDQKYFAQKGMLANNGDLVLPEKVADWSIATDKTAEATDARARLIGAFDRGGREVDPKSAATAQVNFDCWLEQLEEGHQFDHIAACRDAFEAALADLDKALTPVAVVAVVPEPEPVAAPPDAIVFFDFDSAEVTDGARRTLQQSLAGAADQVRRVTVVGHADRAGPDAYNDALSNRRAEAVKAALTQLGIDGATVTTVAVGETDPLVATPDGVREPQNRRARVRYEVEIQPTS